MKELNNNLYKYGKTAAGVQRFKDKETNKVFIDPMVKLERDKIKDLAIKMFIEEGIPYRKVGRILGVHHTTVSRWVLTEANTRNFTQLIDYDNVKEVQVDEVYFISSKKKVE